MGNTLRKFMAVALMFMVMFGVAEPYDAYQKGEKVKVGVFDMEGFHSFDEE